MEITLQRIEYSNLQTLGMLYINEHRFYTLELGWHNNQKQKSCIPAGRYEVVKRNSAKYGDHFHVLNVPGRDFILIHHGNYYTDILGCILVSTGLRDLNNDGTQDITSSRVAVQEMNTVLPAKFVLRILS